MAPLLDARDPLSDEFRTAISAIVAEFLAGRRTALAPIAPLLADVLDVAAALSSGGKRIRPAFVCWGRIAAAGVPDDPTALLRAAASMELWHVGILVHDDVMDASDTRRGLPAAHRSFAGWHTEGQGYGSPQGYGQAGAILLGTELVAWSGVLLRESGLDAAALARALPAVEAMRDEVLAGQWLDITAQAGLTGRLMQPQAPPQSRAIAERVVEYKTSRYTVQRPVQVGALLGGAGPEVVAGLAEFGSRIGRGFQYRDDLLGVFGDETSTGKPTGGDLREGKRTALIAEALTMADSAAAVRLQALLGDPDLDDEGIAAARQIITESGAALAIEDAIATDYEQALKVLECLNITSEGRLGLVNLSRASVERVS